ncbi:MAG: hypothetical protein NTY19_20880 [Planctomycetota bacterium]|nr:hypothetical protein [Planctomycetota bacterium]
MNRPTEKALHLFQLLEQLPIVGAEASFKMQHGLLLRHRLLWAISTRDLPPERLLEICLRLDMPPDQRNTLQQQLAGANAVFFGFEETDATCGYRVYLEFWEQLQAALQRQPAATAPAEPALLHLGFKWDAFDNRAASIAHYHCYPGLSVRDSLARLTEIYRAHPTRVPETVATSLIRFAASRIDATSEAFIYLEATEGTSPRLSFDINLYKARLRVAEVSPWLMQLRDYYELRGGPFDAFSATIGSRTLAHLSGGIDRRGHDFFTVYYRIDDVCR